MDCKLSDQFDCLTNLIVHLQPYLQLDCNYLTNEHLQVSLLGFYGSVFGHIRLMFPKDQLKIQQKLNYLIEQIDSTWFQPPQTSIFRLTLELLRKLRSNIGKTVTLILLARLLESHDQVQRLKLDQFDLFKQFMLSLNEVLIYLNNKILNTFYNIKNLENTNIQWIRTKITRLFHFVLICLIYVARDLDLKKHVAICWFSNYLQLSVIEKLCSNDVKIKNLIFKLNFYLGLTETTNIK